MPMQTPSRGFVAAASRTAASSPESRSWRMQSGIAPWPGRTTRSAAATTSGSDVTTTAISSRAVSCLARDVSHRLRDRAQVAHPVVDDGDSPLAHVGTTIG